MLFWLWTIISAISNQVEAVENFSTQKLPVNHSRSTAIVTCRLRCSLSPHRSKCLSHMHRTCTALEEKGLISTMNRIWDVSTMRGLDRGGDRCLRFWGERKKETLPTFRSNLCVKETDDAPGVQRQLLSTGSQPVRTWSWTPKTLMLI